MTEPTTAAGRRLVAEQRDPCAVYTADPGAEDWDAWATREVLAIEAEARQQDGSVLREAALYALGFMNDPEGLAAVREEWRDRLREALAALPPSAPPPERCGVTIYGLDCILPRSHNVGRADIPENHQAAPPAPPALDVGLIPLLQTCRSVLAQQGYSGMTQRIDRILARLQEQDR